MFLLYFVGLIFLIIGLGLLLETFYFRFYARELEGVVISYESDSSNDGTFYYPIVEYQEQNKIYRFRSGIGSGTFSYTLQQKVPILLLGEAHSSARLKGHYRRLLFSLFVFMGTISCTLGFYLLEWGMNLFFFTLFLLFFILYLWMKVLDKERKRKEKHFDYTPYEGVIGYRRDPLKELAADHIEKQHILVKKMYKFNLFFGIFLLGVASVWSYNLQQYISSAKHIQGSVVGHLNSSSSSENGTTLIRALIEFTPENSEKKVRFKSAIGSSTLLWKKGDSVWVYYRPQNPKDAMQDLGVFNYSIQIFIALLGLFSIFIGLKKR